MTLRVTAVVPTHRRPSSIAGCLGALLVQPELDELVVVVDGPDPETEAVLQRMSDPRLVTVVLPENRGRSAARQAGVERATGDVVALLDDDVLSGPGLMAGHRGHHEDAESLVVVGQLHTPTPRKERGNAPTRLYSREQAMTMARREPILERLWGGNLSLRRDDAMRVGLDNHFDASNYEDADFGFRCAEAGLTGLYDAKLHAEHMHSRSLPQFLADAYEAGRGRALLGQRHPQAKATWPSDASWIRTLASPALIGPTTQLFSAAASTHPDVEMFCARVLRRLHQYRGMTSVGA